MRETFRATYEKNIYTCKTFQSYNTYVNLTNLTLMGGQKKEYKPMTHNDKTTFFSYLTLITLNDSEADIADNIFDTQRIRLSFYESFTLSY